MSVSGGGEGAEAEAARLEKLSEELYTATSSDSRREAERALAELANSDAAFQRSMLMLQRGAHDYARLVAAETLTKLLSRPNSSLPLSQRAELAEYILNYLGRHHDKLQPFVRQALARLWGRLVKLGWFDFSQNAPAAAASAKSSRDGFVFRAALSSVVKMVAGKDSMVEVVVGVDLLSAAVAEMNSQTGLGSISKHRKTAAVFRDEELFAIFQLAVEFLGAAADQPSSFTDAAQAQLVGQLLELAHACLSFDFIGSIVDETSDDNSSVQVPTSWRSIFVQGSLSKLFFRLFSALSGAPLMAAKVLATLVQLTSVRRTIFNNAERSEYLQQLVKGTLGILQAPQPLLSSAEVYHEFCRLVARLKANYQLMELTKIPEYQALISLLADFTISSLRHPEASSNNVHYLLSFWQRMVSSQPYVKASEPHQLGHFAPLVTKAFVESRLEAMEAVVARELENPFEDFTSLAQQMEQIGVIGRCEYLQTAALLAQAFAGSTPAYTGASLGSKELKVAEGRVTWLIFLVGSAIGGRVAFSSSEEQDSADGELISKVLQLMQLSDERLAASNGSGGSEDFELAVIYFLAQFRKIYISDQVQKTSKVYTKLSEELGLVDEAAVLGVFIRKVVANLKYWAGNERLVEESLSLLNDLSCGFTSARKLIALPEIQFLLANHSPAEFPFLGTETSLQAMKGRTTFHAALTRLLLVDLPESPEALEAFLAPLETSLKELAAALASQDPSLLRAQESAKKAVIGIARDLRGVALALNVKSAFARLFDWLYPEALDTFIKAMELWHSDADVTTAVLRLGAEICQNRSQRLAFEATSPNAILLFKEASRLVQAYGRGVLSLGEVSQGEDVWRSRLKGVSISMGLLKAALAGAYVNFGVFRLYGDTCLEDALNVFVRLVTAIPRPDLQAYSKLCQNYYFLLETLSADHMPYLSQLDPQVFAFFLRTLGDALSSLDTIIVTTATSTLDNFATYLFQRLKSAQVPKSKPRHIGQAPEGDGPILAIRQEPELLIKLLSAILQQVMFEECRCQWSLSRPLLGLCLLLPQPMAQLEMELVSAQPPPAQPLLQRSFQALMADVDRNSLGIKNKDKFTQNLATFRREVTEILKGEAPAASNGKSEMMM